MINDTTTNTPNQSPTPWITNANPEDFDSLSDLELHECISPYSSGDEDNLSSFSSSSFERVEDDESYDDNLDQDDNNSQSATDDKQPTELPFWYTNEDSAHIEAIFKKYLERLVPQTEYLSRSVQPFIGRIARQVSASSTSFVFQTLDEVELCNNQRLVTPNSPLPLIRTIHVVTSWDQDGIPTDFFILDSPEILNYWEQNLADVPCSYLYCLPDWFNQSTHHTRFIYSSSCDRNIVSYANLPWERTAYHCVTERLLSSRCNDFTNNEFWQDGLFQS